MHLELDLAALNLCTPAQLVSQSQATPAPHSAQAQTQTLDQLTVQAPSRSYEIVIGKQLLSNPETFADVAAGKEILVVTNPTVAGLHLEALLQGLQPHAKKLQVVEVIDSEAAKSAQYLEQIYTTLIEHNFSRRCLIVAFGGGVIGDLAGYAASTYNRGVAFVQIPTTLLAQVDSSVGGKTAINHPLGKNLIGSFYQPHKVIIDIDTLETLPQREFSAGMAEIIKYGYLSSPEINDTIASHLPQMMQRDPASLAYIIGLCCRLKGQVVALDEKEDSCRALLNLGHTFGHAIEAHQGYGKLLHGEAVSIGMALAVQTTLYLQQTRSQEFNAATGFTFTTADMHTMVARLEQAGLPTQVPQDMTADDFLFYMSKDKKNLADQIVLVLPTSYGRSTVVANTTRADITEVINQAKIA